MKAIIIILSLCISLQAEVSLQQTHQVQNFVKRFYQEVLERSADNGGLDTWTNQLIHKEKTGADVGFGFIFSDEFIAKDKNDNDFLSILYKAFFNREADSEGLSGWLSKLSSGISREKVLSGFTHSEEFINLANIYNIQAFDGASFESAELTDFVKRFYTVILGREADGGGLSDWTGRLSSGVATGSDIAFGFVFSDEYNQESKDNEEYLTTLYKAFFDREPDASGFSNWLEKLNAGESRNSILNNFLHSVEFINLSNAYGITAFPGAPIVEPLVNVSPTANAGNDVSVPFGTNFTLDASASTDSDGTLMHYIWSEGTVIIGESMTLNNSNFSLGSHMLLLTVVDDNGASASDYVEVVIEPVNFNISSIPNVTQEENAIYTSTTPNLIGDTPIGAVSYTLSGIDAGHFMVDVNTGIVTLSSKDYESPEDANGDNVYEVTIIATDTTSYSTSISWTITVTDIADVVPTLANATGSVSEDAVAGTNVGSITIIDSGDRAITAIALSSTGANNFSVSNTGVISVASGASLDFSITPSYALTVVATSASGTSTSVAVDITVEETNVPPVANDKNVSTVEDNNITIDLKPLFSDANSGQTVALSAFSQGSNGVVVETGEGNVTYTPNLGYVGTDSFNYTVADDGVGTLSDTATITVEVVATPSVQNVDPYIIGAILCEDVNTNSICDAGEQLSTLTDINGTGTFSQPLTPGSHIITKVQGLHEGLPYDLNITGLVDVNGDVDIVSPLTTFETRGMIKLQIATLLNTAATSAGLSGWTLSTSDISLDPLAGGLSNKDFAALTNGELVKLQATLATYGLLKIMDGSDLRLLTGTDIVNSPAVALLAENMLTTITTQLNTTVLTNISGQLDTVRSGIPSGIPVAVVNAGLPEPTVNTVIKVSVAVINRLSSIGLSTSLSTPGNESAKVTAALTAVQTYTATHLTAQDMSDLATQFYAMEAHDAMDTAFSGPYSAVLTGLLNDPNLSAGYNATETGKVTIILDASGNFVPQ